MMLVMASPQSNSTKAVVVCRNPPSGRCGAGPCAPQLLLLAALREKKSKASTGLLNQPSLQWPACLLSCSCSALFGCSLQPHSESPSRR